MANTILRKRSLIPGRTSELVLDAPHIADKARPGNFVILRVCENGERIPLTIADTDKDAGTITIVYLVLGKTTAHLETLNEGEEIHDLCGIGMCGACRVSVDGQTRFTCVDGPEFDGQLVDFAELSSRLSAFEAMEKISYEEFRKNHVCKCSR